MKTPSRMVGKLDLLEVAAVIGRVPLVKLSPQHVQMMLTERLATLSPKTCRHLRTCLFEKAVQGHPFGAAFVLALATGSREGEILGLQWSRVDLDRKQIEIAVQLQRIYSKPVPAAAPAPAEKTAPRTKPGANLGRGAASTEKGPNTTLVN